MILDRFRIIQENVQSLVGDTNPDIRIVLKDIRRKGKNKNSAAISRHKKLSRIQQLRIEKEEKVKKLHSIMCYISKIKVRCGLFNNFIGP